MNKSNPLSAYICSVMIAFFAGFTTYQSLSDLSQYPLINNDLMYLVSMYSVVLFGGVPLLLITPLMSIRGSERGHLTWLGILCFFQISYFIISCETASNHYFLLNILIFSLSFYTFIRLMSALDPEFIKLRFSTKTPVRTIASFAIFGGFLLAYIWLMQFLPEILKGYSVELFKVIGSGTSIRQVLVLGIIAPLTFFSGVWLWKRKAWGFIFTIILLVSGILVEAVYLTSLGLGYFAKHFFQLNKVLAFGGYTILTIIITAVLLRNLREEVLQDYHNRLPL